MAINSEIETTTKYSVMAIPARAERQRVILLRMAQTRLISILFIAAYLKDFQETGIISVPGANEAGNLL